MTLFVVTGYSRFPGCPENPTERLVNRLKEELSKSTRCCSSIYKPYQEPLLPEIQQNDVDNVTRLATFAAIHLRSLAYERCLPGPATPASCCVQGVSRLWCAKYFQYLRSLSISGWLKPPGNCHQVNLSSGYSLTVNSAESSLSDDLCVVRLTVKGVLMSAGTLWRRKQSRALQT